MQKIWDDLTAHQSGIHTRKITILFENDNRAAEFSVKTDGLLFDFSKTNIDDSALALLVSLAERANFSAKRDAMFSGVAINETEGRAVLHTALRNLSGKPILVDGQDVMPDILSTLTRMEVFAEAVRSGEIKGQGGAITDVVNIGIGGSDLGPAMAVRALTAFADGPRVHFVSNVDGADVADTLAGLDPTTTMVIVASKTFTTIETMTNATTARDWMAKSVANTGAQFAALSTSAEKTSEFGISADRVFGFEDWVGGRYSLWGPIGLSIMLSVGAEDFRSFLAGGEAMDKHFTQADLAENMPVLLALVGIWHHQVCGYPTRAVLPYEQRLGLLAAYFQQLEMESNGKGVAMSGDDLPMPAGPIVWGEPGTNGQHAFYQLIHQGRQVIPCEFMIGAKGHEAELAHHHDLLVANCLAQSEALMLGRDLETARGLMAQKGLSGDELERQARHRVFTGNRPSTTLVYPSLTPFVLGQIIALYEHRVFVEGVIMGINSFDQWGVELGKELATALEPMVQGKESADHKDGSTQSLLKFISGS